MPAFLKKQDIVDLARSSVFTGEFSEHNIHIYTLIGKQLYIVGASKKNYKTKRDIFG